MTTTTTKTVQEGHERGGTRRESATGSSVTRATASFDQWAANTSTKSTNDLVKTLKWNETKINIKRNNSGWYTRTHLFHYAPSALFFFLQLYFFHGPKRLANIPHSGTRMYMYTGGILSCSKTKLDTLSMAPNEWLQRAVVVCRRLINGGKTRRKAAGGEGRWRERGE